MRCLPGLVLIVLLSAMTCHVDFSVTSELFKVLLFNLQCTAHCLIDKSNLSCDSVIKCKHTDNQTVSYCNISMRAHTNNQQYAAVNHSTIIDFHLNVYF